MKLHLDSDQMKKNVFSGAKQAILLEKGQVLYISGQKPKYFYIVNAGKIGLFEERKERLLSIDTVASGGLLSGSSLFSSGVFDHTAIALEKTEIFKIKLEDMKAVIHMCPEWVNDIMNTIWSRLENSLHILKEHQIYDEVGLKFNLDKRTELLFKKSIDVFKSAVRT